MPIKVFNQPPYFDDYDETKNYMRVLFSPAYAIQARELNQLQTAIQAQIDRFGQHVFKDGSPVVGGLATLDTKYAFVKLESTFTVSGTTYYPEGDGGSNLAYYTTCVGQTMLGGTSGVTAKVLEIIPSQGTDPLTAYVAYTAAGSNNTDHVFQPGEVLTFTDSGSGASRKFQVKTLDTVPTGYGTRVAVNEGVYFVLGNFVYTPAESIIIAKYAINPSARVVYKVSENIVTSSDDSSLNDNATGTPNEGAPGAHRYQINLDLVIEPYDDSVRTEPNVIQLLIIRDGAVVGQARTEYSELSRTLATRTYEESGNYTVRPFQINVREYLNDGTNGGLYTQAQIQDQNPGMTSSAALAYGQARLAIGLEPSVAYVNGYRVETLDTTYVPVLKARDMNYVNLGSVFCPLGGYVYVDHLVGLPNFTYFSKVTLKNGSGTSIGTARARAIEYYSGTIGTTAAKYKLYLFDVAITSGTFADVKTVSDTTVPGYDFSATVSDPNTSITTAVLYDTADSSLIYKLPATAVSTLRETGGSVGFVYYVYRAFNNVATDGSGKITLSSSTNEFFYSVDPNQYVCVKASDGSLVSPSNSTPTLGGSGSSNTITLDFGSSSASTYFYISAPVRRNLAEKTKTLVTGTTSGTGTGQITISVPNTMVGQYDSLGITDLLRVKAVHMSANLATPATTSDPDISDRYDVDDGQRENFYDVAQIRLRPGSTPPSGQLLVVVDYFTHSPGDYFSVDSYSAIPYEDIPSFNSIKGAIQLRDAIDFRPIKSNDGSTFDPTDGSHPGASVSSTVVPNSIVLTDISYYLPRADKIYVNKDGDFGVAYGISSDTPTPPADPSDSMVLYSITLGAYTFGVSDVQSTMIDNKRYTMRDIGRLEKRIANVEYYTSLSLLEKETAQKQILDSTGTQQRYKNGFVVDPFIDHSIGNVSHPDYHCAIDRDTGTLRPEFVQDNVKLVADLGSSTGIKKTGRLVTLDYTEVPMISQPYSSYAEYVNAHSVFTWDGHMTLSPAEDEWKDTEREPDVVLNPDGQLNWFLNVNPGASSRIVWNDWQTTWLGSIPAQDTSGSSSSSTSTGSISATQLGTKTRTGTVTLSSGQYRLTSTVSFQDSVVDTSLAPFIRSRKIYFKVDGLKPNSRVYAFFDGTDVSAYVRQETSFVDYSTNPDNTLYTDATGHPAGATNLVSDSSGSVIGSFVIPNTASLKFRVGKRIFRLTDSSTNSSDYYTAAEAIYTAAGIIETRQATSSGSTVISTIEPVKVQSPPPATSSSSQPTISPTVDIEVRVNNPVDTPPDTIFAHSSVHGNGYTVTAHGIDARGGSDPDISASGWVTKVQKTGLSAPEDYISVYLRSSSDLPPYSQYRSWADTSAGARIYTYSGVYHYVPSS